MKTWQIVMLSCAAAALLLLAVGIVLVANAAATVPVFGRDLNVPCLLQSAEEYTLAQELRAVIDAQFSAIAEGDVDVAMGLVHLGSPVRATTREVLDAITTYGPPRIAVAEFMLLSNNGHEAKVRAIQYYDFGENLFYKNSVSEEIHTFKKENGKWKIWLSECRMKKATS